MCVAASTGGPSQLKGCAEREVGVLSVSPGHLIHAQYTKSPLPSVPLSCCPPPQGPPPSLALLRPSTGKAKGSSLGVGDRRQKGKGPEIKFSRISSSFWRSRFGCSNLLQGKIMFPCSNIQSRRNVWWVEYLLIYFSVNGPGGPHTHTHTRYQQEIAPELSKFSY